MALSQEEKQIIEYGAKNGKTKPQVMLAIAEYRRKNGINNQPLGIDETIQDVRETASGIVGQFSEAGENIVDTLEDEDLTVGEKTRGIASEGFRRTGRAIGEGIIGAGKLVLPQGFEDRIGATMANVSQKIAENPQVQDFVEGYQELDDDTRREVDNALGFVEGIAEIGTGGLLGRVTSTLGRGAARAGQTIGRGASKAKLPKAARVVGEVVEDLTPTSEAVRDRLVAKSLRLSAVEDIARIEQMTDNNIGDFLGRNGLLANTAEETMGQLTRFQRRNQDLVQNAIFLVDNQYGRTEVPGLDDTIDFLRSDLQKRKSPEFQSALQKLNEISAKESVELSEVQFTKQLFDELESVYKRTGEVKDSIGMQDKAQTATQLRRFIEQSVRDVYPEIDVRALNNNVQTSREIINAVLKRSGKADTESLFKLGDMAILGAGNVTAPGAGFAGLFAKKVFESAPVQLRGAKFFDNRIQKRGRNQVNERNTLTLDDLQDIERLLQDELGAEIAP